MSKYYEKYRIKDPSYLWGALEFYKLSNGEIVLIDDELGETYILDKDTEDIIYVQGIEEFSCYDRPATRRELIESGYWDFVENKGTDEYKIYSCEQEEIEDKLEEYLRIAEKKD